jgi:hypothetical protein
MIFHYTLRGSIQVPEGSTLNATGSTIVLPDGQNLQLWESWETNRDDENHKDISYKELLDMGCFYDGNMAQFEEGGE